MADFMIVILAGFGFTEEADDNVEGDEEVAFGFAAEDLSFSGVAEEVEEIEFGIVDEDEDGNPFLELTEEEIEASNPPASPS